MNLDFDIREIVQEGGKPALYKVLRRICTNGFQLCSPKDYKIQHRELWGDPEEFALQAIGCSISALGGDPGEDATAFACHVVASKLIRYGVPTFYVGHELCDALLKTTPPDDLSFADLHWPMEAMLFVLPRDFSVKYFGDYVPFVAVSHMDAGEEVSSPLILKHIDTGESLRIPDVTINPPKPSKYWIATMVKWENGYPVNYDSRAIYTSTVKGLMSFEEFKIYRENADPQEVEDGKQAARRMSALALNLMLAMDAEPELISREKLLRPAQKQGKTVLRKPLWKPHWIGEHFRVEYEKHAPEGTHRSPIAHWRVGHWRNQRFGPLLANSKRIWIKPVFVGLSHAPTHQLTASL